MYLLDYTTGRYLIVSAEAKHVMGLDACGFIEGGVQFMMAHYHPDHFRLFNNKIFDTRLTFLKAIPPEQHANYIFTYNHRFRDAKGQYADYLQRNRFIKSDSDGNPLVSFGMINYNHFSIQQQVVHTIEKMIASESGTYAELVDKKPPNTAALVSFALRKGII